MVGTNSNTYNNYTLPVSDTTISLYSDHYYYARFIINGSKLPYSWGVVSSDNVSYLARFNSSSISNSLIFNVEADLNSKIFAGVAASTEYDCNFYVTLIDLTQMYGSDIASSLTASQCDDIFTAPYYSYTDSLILLSDNFDSFQNGYMKGVEDTLASYTLTATSASVYSSLIAVDYGTLTNISKEIIILDNVQYYACVVNGYGKLPFNIAGNQTISVDIGQFSIWTSDADPTVDIKVGYQYNGDFVWLIDITKSRSEAYLIGHYDFYIPYDIDGLIFHMSEQFMIANTSITYKTYNLQDAITIAQNTAVTETTEYYQKYYSPGNPGYTAIFNAGAAAAESNNAVFQDSWSFVSSAFTSVGEILSVEIFPNVPLGTFVAFPLLLSLIFFIVKLTKGGS